MQDRAVAWFDASGRIQLRIKMCSRPSEMFFSKDTRTAVCPATLHRSAVTRHPIGRPASAAAAAGVATPSNEAEYKDALLKVLKAKGSMSLSELGQAVSARMAGLPHRHHHHHHHGVAWLGTA